MRLSKFVKKGAVAALALFAAVAIVSCSSPSGSDSGDGDKKEQQRKGVGVDLRRAQALPGLGFELRTVKRHFVFLPKTFVRARRSGSGKI